MNDPTEPLIDGTYGYGSQSLINLMLTGRAVGHVWDHDQDVGGLSKYLLYYEVNPLTAVSWRLLHCTCPEIAVHYDELVNLNMCKVEICVLLCYY